MTLAHYHPFQKLCYVGQVGSVGLLLAAAGPYILSLNLVSGGVLSKWPDDTSRLPHEQAFGGSLNGASRSRSKDDDPPSKRRKLSTSPEGVAEDQDSDESSLSIEFVSERAKGQRRKRKKMVKPTLPNVSHISCTADGHHVIAATAEDKCVRVFEIDSLGRLKPQSQRCMPKRLCAVALTKNQSTILAGDKFGDVYALPLHSSFNPNTVSPSKPRLEIPKPFKPSASELTVHTKGNREALRQQKLQKAALTKKLEPNFEHQLIIGHVSLLTDLVVGTDPSHGSREYILTADRDEHIRVSRGMPQAHVIDSYCLGHTDFVSRLCITQERPQFLISGGGEPALCIYDWLRGIVVAKANLEHDLKQIARSTPFSELPECSEKRAVSCIQALYIKRSDHREEAIMIIAALEGAPGILTYLFDPREYILKQKRQYLVSANVLDIALIKDKRTMLVSLDNVHSPLSTKRPVPYPLPPMISFLELQIDPCDGNWQYEWIECNPEKKGNAGMAPCSFGDIASKLERTMQSEVVRHEIEVEEEVKPRPLYSRLGEFLYGLENLRKKYRADGDGQQAEEVLATNPEET